MEPPTTPDVTVTVPATVLDELSSGYALSSTWVVFFVTLAVAVLVGLGARWIWRKRHHDSHRVRVTVGSAIGAVLVALAAVVGVNAYVGYVPTFSGLSKIVHSWFGDGQVAKATTTSGGVNAISVPSDHLNAPAETAVWVYTPPGYDPNSGIRYPVIYLIHGDPGRPSDWFVAGDASRTMDVLLAHSLVRPMILVSLDVNGGRGSKDTGCLNWDGHRGPQVESWIYQDVIPFIDSTYSTVADRSGRAIAGMSSGGFCALDQGLRHNDTWSVLLSFEGFGSPGQAGLKAFSGDQARVNAVSPEVYLPGMTFRSPIAAYLDVGSEVGEVDQVRSLAQALADHGQTVMFRVNQGEAHTWSEVQAGLPYALVFASQRLSGGP